MQFENNKELDLDFLRDNYAKYLDEKEKELKNDKNNDSDYLNDVNTLYTQFCNFVSIHLLNLYAHDKFKGEEAKDFLEEFVDNYINQLKTNFFRGFEVHELKQEGGPISKLIGQDMLKRGNEFGKRKATKIINKFEDHIKKVLLIDEIDKNGEETI